MLRLPPEFLYHSIYKVFPNNGKKLLLLQERPDRLRDPLNLPFSRYGYFFQGVNQPGPEANHPPPSAEVKNE